MPNEQGPGAAVSGRLGYLLKHTGMRLQELSDQALAPFGITPHELPVLILIASHAPASQQQAAQRLGIDRTSMVALLDTLEAKGLVVRQPDTADRRRNVVELTDTGQDVLRRATLASDAAERELLGPLSEEDAQHLRDALRAIVA